MISVDGLSGQALWSALDAAVASVPPKPALMPGSVRRWIPAARPFSDLGGAVSASMIEAMAATLNRESVSVPIDGGEPGSVTHGTASDVATGWVHRAVVAELDGEPSLYLEAELLPHVAALIDAGRLAYSSIEATYRVDESGAPIASTTMLVSQGLTNTPRNRRMQPIQTAADVRVAHSYTRARPATEGRMAAMDQAPAQGAPATEAPSGETALPSVEELMQQLEALRAENEALKAASSQMSEQLASVQASIPTPEQVRAEKAEAALDKAIAEGRFAASARASYAKYAHADLDGFAKLAASLRPMTQRQTAPTAVVSNVGDAEFETLRQSLKAAGMASDAIERQVAKAKARSIKGGE